MQEWSDTERWEGFAERFKLLPVIIIIIAAVILLICLAVHESKKENFNDKKFIFYVIGIIAGVIFCIFYMLSFDLIPYAGL